MFLFEVWPCSLTLKSKHPVATALANSEKMNSYLSFQYFNYIIFIDLIFILYIISIIYFKGNALGYFIILYPENVQWVHLKHVVGTWFKVAQDTPTEKRDLIGSMEHRLPIGCGPVPCHLLSAAFLWTCLDSTARSWGEGTGSLPSTVMQTKTHSPPSVQ